MAHVLRYLSLQWASGHVGVRAGFAFNKPSDILRIYDAVGKSNFGLLYDTCHGQMVGVNERGRKALRKFSHPRLTSCVRSQAASTTFT